MFPLGDSMLGWGGGILISYCRAMTSVQLMCRHPVDRRILRKWNENNREGGQQWSPSDIYSGNRRRIKSGFWLYWRATHSSTAITSGEMLLLGIKELGVVLQKTNGIRRRWLISVSMPTSPCPGVVMVVTSWRWAPCSCGPDLYQWREGYRSPQERQEGWSGALLEVCSRRLEAVT